MSAIAILFLVGVALRVFMWYFMDDGFGGPVWDAIMWVSSLTWLFGAILACDYLDLLPEVSW